MAVPSCVHQAVALAAARVPDAIAVTSEGRHVTYSGLMRAAQRLAAGLRAAGVGVESRVAIVMDRSVDLVVALLGTLEAGGAYVPLDPAATAERLTTLVRDAGAVCVVTRESLRARVPELGLPVIVVDAAVEATAASGPAADATLPQPTGDHLCYVMYTSGTTGEPKGVAVSHAAVLNFLGSMRRAPGLTAADALLAVTPITFDIAGLEIFLPLTTGARLILAPRHSGADGRDLHARLVRENVSTLQATPATWHLLLDAGWRAPARFRVLCGGEALPPELARQVIAAAGHVWNCYGPTETTIWSTLACVDNADQISIGRPIAQTRVYLLDRTLEPVPIGVLADLYIAGAGLARGYLGRPATTAASFVPDPFSDAPGTRMYATGDLARYRSDGRIDCRGRRDHQVKLHGRRIELEAISHVLDTHPLVRASVVAVRESASRGAFLAAYVVAHEKGIVRADLRDHLARHLPAYMVPSAIVVLEAVPRTAHGKIDRRALPPPAESDFRAAGALVAPRTPSEHAVARAWREVLGVATVGVEDDFFDLGGNSLQATRVLLLVRTGLGADLSMQTFFERPTVAALAEHVDRALESGAQAGPTIARVARDGALTLAPQQENWWASERVTGNVNPNTTLFGIRLAGPLQRAALDQAIAALQRRHEAFRTAFVVDEHDRGTPVLLDAASCPVQLQTIDLSGLAPEARARTQRELLQRDNDRPFDLGSAPLCRAWLVRLAADDHALTFNMPYLVCDGWSVNVVLNDLGALYAAAIGGEPAALPPLRFEYVDFARWQHEWLAGPAAAAQLTYWREQLAPPWPALLQRSPAAADFDTPFFSIRGVLPFAFRSDATEAARQVARRERCTLYSTVLTALKLVLHARDGQPDVRVATLAANRRLAGAEQVVGVFANAVCLRTRIERSGSFAEHVRHVHAAIGDATAHQDLPVEILARALEEEHGIPSSQLVQVMVFWGIPTATEGFPGLEGSAYRLEDEESVVMARNRLDLRLALLDTPTALTGTFTYRMSLFTPAEIRGLVDSIERCLMRAALDPAVNIDALCDLPTTA